MFWWRNRDGYSVQHKSNSSTLNNEVDVYHQDYINNHRNYFDRLLGARLTGKKIIEPLDITILKEAYDKAHLMRNFEIDLFWKRAGYCFTIMAALIALCGGLLSSYSKGKNEELLDIILFISFIGVIFTMLSNFMISSGEYWKKNWELHISMLEPLFSGHIYSTHLVSNRVRISITRLTLLFSLVMYACWASVIFFIANDKERLLDALLAFLAIMVVYIIILTASKNKPESVFITSYSVEIVKEKNRKEKIRRFISQSIWMIVLMIPLLTVILSCITYYWFGDAFFWRFLPFFN